MAGRLRCLVDQSTAGSSNMRLARTAPAIGAGDLREDVGGEIAAGEPGAGAAAEPPVGGGHDGVEVRAGDRAEHEDQHAEPERGGDGVLQQLQADVVGESVAATMPEPTTTVTSSPVPRNSASSRRHRAGRCSLAACAAGRRARRAGRGRGVRSRRGSGGRRRRPGRRGRRGPSSRSGCRGRSGRRRRSPW